MHIPQPGLPQGVLSFCKGMPSCGPPERFPQRVPGGSLNLGQVVPPAWATWLPRLLGPGSPQSVPQKLPWRSPVIFREQKVPGVAKQLPLAVSSHSRVEKVCPNFSQHVPHKLPCQSPVIFREQTVAKKLPLAVSSHSRVEKVCPKIAFGGSNCET